MKITPILSVEAIEPCLPFWLDQLGFQKTVEVPHGNKLGFVILVKDGAEIMMDTYAGRAADYQSISLLGAGSSTLFIEVNDFADIRKRVQGAEVAVPERVTFYGMREIGIKVPGGHFVVFAAKEPATEPQR